MLIVGAKGYAKELLQHFHNSADTNNLYFFDNISDDLPDLLYNKFPVIRTFDSAMELFNKVDNQYVLGVGNPKTRYLLSKKMNEINGDLLSIIMINTEVGSYGTIIGKGVNIMSGTIITNDIKIDDGVLINLNCTIGHDSYIGKFCELSPGVHISGHVQIGNFTSIGTGAVVIPNVEIGRNCVVGAGSVVNKNIPDNSVAVGVPAKIIKQIDPFNELMY